MIGVFGSPGFYKLLDNLETIDKETPFGKPSSPVNVGTISGKEVAFIARHGLQHEFPPHRIPYKSNLYAFKELGVTRIIAPAAATSLKRNIEPGSFLVPDQFVNFTRRDDTFYEERPVTHISCAEPYCPELRALLAEAGKQMQLKMHEKGAAVIIEGPRFPSLAESAFYRSQGWDAIDMTQYPEMVLARELEMCYANISLVTDYDSAIKADIHGEVPDRMNDVEESNEKLRKLIFEVIPKIAEVRTCICSHALEGSRI